MYDKKILETDLVEGVKMSRETTHRDLEVVTRKWWFFLIFLLIQFTPPWGMGIQLVDRIERLTH